MFWSVEFGSPGFEDSDLGCSVHRKPGIDLKRSIRRLIMRLEDESFNGCYFVAFDASERKLQIRTNISSEELSAEVHNRELPGCPSDCLRCPGEGAAVSSGQASRLSLLSWSHRRES